MSGNFPASSKWIKFLFLHLQTLCPHSVLCIMFSNQLVIGLYYLPCHFILPCSSLMLFFPVFKNIFLFLLCNPFPSVFNTVTWILSKLGLMSSFSFLIVNHKKVNFMIWIGEDAMWMWLFSLLIFLFSSYISLLIQDLFFFNACILASLVQNTVGTISFSVDCLPNCFSI